MTDPPAVPSGCAAIDSLLGGGFERGTVTQVYGAPASGKTNLALTAAVGTAAAGGTVLYIDSEGLSIDRLEQIAKNALEDGVVEEVLARIIITDVHDFDEQETAIKGAEGIAEELDLLVLDSATGFYRLERIDEPDDDGEALSRLTDQIAHLLGLARRFEVAILITNQVFTDPDDDSLRPLGGYPLEHWSGTILRFDRFRGDRRRVTLEKHRSQSVGDVVITQVTDRGLEGVDPSRP